jgi:hypothetical protein
MSDDAFTNAAIEFHDSTVAAADSDGATLTIVLSPAYIHRSAGAPGADSGTGWSQDVVMVLYDCQMASEFPGLPLVLYDGLATIGDQTYAGAVPLPLSDAGPVCMDLSFENGAHVRLSAAKIRVDAIGDATYLEEFPGADA